MFEEAKEHRDVPMRHIIGDHSKCGDWCLAKRTKATNKPYDKPPMFDLNKPRDKYTYDGVKKVHDKATTDERLIEMLHPFTTQLNESLNMRAAETAPKCKNYSRTASLDYRISIVVGVHNIGSHDFFQRVFQDLGIEYDDAIASWFLGKDSTKMKKKMRDTTPHAKRRRKHRYLAKERDELLLERTKDVKMGTYGSGIGLAEGNENVHAKDADVSLRKRGYCTCGGSKKHKNRNSKYCMTNKKTLYKHLMSIT